MPQNSPATTVRLGLFIVLGVGFLLVLLYLMGRQQSLFGPNMVVEADFRNVSGLLTGNSVRQGGITVGNVKAINLLNDSTVRVSISLSKDA
jgi:phospholipid/cholesterol/gamma-HCH transport system substrate-binding protein